MEKIVIIGGGISGLSCLNALLDAGISPLLLEAGKIGSPKMCGEFIAPPALPYLKRWGVDHVHRVHQAIFRARNRSIQVSFPSPAGAYPRAEAEKELAQAARARGGRILEETSLASITPATPSSPHVLHLKDSSSIVAQDIMVATGKLSGKTIRELPYIGFKTHVNKVIHPETLVMVSMPDAYFGIVPISLDQSNLTCLARRPVIEQAGSSKLFLNQIVKKYVDLQELFNTINLADLDILEVSVPDFGLKALPPWPRAYWIGDAIASFYPSIGYGFAHAITSAVMAVDAYLNNDEIGYHRAIHTLIKPNLWWGKKLHTLLEYPQISACLTSGLGESNVNCLSRLILNKLSYVQAQ